MESGVLQGAPLFCARRANKQLTYANKRPTLVLVFGHINRPSGPYTESTDMATIYDIETGDTITAGLQGCNDCDEAVIAARSIAARRDEAVLLEDDDGAWRVEPGGRIVSIAVPTVDVDEDDLRALRNEAAIAGDDAQVAMCTSALRGDLEAIWGCLEVISANLAADVEAVGG